MLYRDSLASNHPHAQKQSVLDGQFSLDVLSPTTSVPPSPYTPNSSTSTFSLPLDPIAEGTHSPYTSTPAIGSPTIEPVSFPHHNPTPTSNSVYAYPPPHPHSYTNHRPAPIGLGQPSNPPKPYPHTAFANYIPTKQHRVDPILLCPAYRHNPDHANSGGACYRRPVADAQCSSIGRSQSCCAWRREHEHYFDIQSSVVSCVVI
jgi:hypothetical protein